MKPKRGEIYQIKLNGDRIGSEYFKNRPGVVVSNDIGNRHSNICTVVLLTSLDDYFWIPTHVKILARHSSVAKCEHIRTISNERLGEYIRTCTEAEMAAIDQALMISFDINPAAENTAEAVEAEAAEWAMVLKETTDDLECKLEQCKQELDFYKQQYDRLYNAVLSGIEKKRRVGEICD